MATQAFIRAPSTTFSKKPVLETLQSIYDNNTRQKLANASILSRRASFMETDMIKLKLLHWCSKSLRALTMAMRAHEWLCTSTQNLVKLSKRTSVVIPRRPRPRRHLNCHRRSYSISAKNAIKEINFGSKVRAAKSIGHSSLLPNNADKPRQQRTTGSQKFKSLRSHSLMKFHPVSPALQVHKVSTSALNLPV